MCNQSMSMLTMYLQSMTHEHPRVLPRKLEPRIEGSQIDRFKVEGDGCSFHIDDSRWKSHTTLPEARVFLVVQILAYLCVCSSMWTSSLGFCEFIICIRFLTWPAHAIEVPDHSQQQVELPDWEMPGCKGWATSRAVKRFRGQQGPNVWKDPGIHLNSEEIHHLIHTQVEQLMHPSNLHQSAKSIGRVMLFVILQRKHTDQFRTVPLATLNCFNASPATEVQTYHEVLDAFGQLLLEISDQKLVFASLCSYTCFARTRENV